MKYLIVMLIAFGSCSPPQRGENAATMAPVQEWDANEKLEELGIVLPEASSCESRISRIEDARISQQEASSEHRCNRSACPKPRSGAHAEAHVPERMSRK